MNRKGFFANLISSFRQFNAQRFFFSSPGYVLSKKSYETNSGQGLKGFKRASFYRRQKMGKRKRLIV